MLLLTVLYFLEATFLTSIIVEEEMERVPKKEE
jgi:hypothetical protein